MGQEVEMGAGLEEEELDQDGIDDFDFVASSEITKSPLTDGSVEIDDLSEDEAPVARRFTKGRKNGEDVGKEDITDKKVDVTHKKRKQTESPDKEEVTEKKKKNEEREKEESKERDRSKKERTKERDGEKSKDRRDRVIKRRPVQEWDHYEPSKDKERPKKRDESRSPRESRSESLETKSKKLELESDDDNEAEVTNGTSHDSLENPQEQAPKELKNEQPYTPTNKFANRKQSQFGQKLAGESRPQIRQPTLLSAEPQNPLNDSFEEQPRYRNYSSRTKSNNKPPGDRQNDPNDWKQNNHDNGGRMFAPQVYSLLEYGSAQPMVTNSRALPMTQMGAPPPPGGALIPGVQMSVHNIPAIMNQTYNKPYQPSARRGGEENRPQQVRDIQPRTDTKVPQEIALLEDRRKVFRDESSRIIVKHLSKYFKAGRIANKDDFKHLSRKLAHKVMKKEEGTGFLMTGKTPKKIKKYVDAFFKKRPGVYAKEQKEWQKPLALQSFETRG